MRLDQKAAKNIAIHAAIWMIYILYEYSITSIVNNNVWRNFWPILSLYISNISVFYLTSLVILPRCVPSKQYFYLVGSLLLLVLTSAIPRYGVYIFLMPYLEVESPVSSIRDKAFWGELLYRGVYFISFGSGYWFARNAILGERKRRILVKQRRKQEQLRRTERDLLETELAFLKFQFNPHFLYNTLNYFYAETSDVSEKVADGILKLSDILRYSLRESLDNKVALTDEIHFLENFIDIHQLRFNNCLHIHFQVEGKVEQQRILPLVLISFVENALKHGNLTDPAAPLVIQLTVCDANIQFYVKNKKSKQHREMVSTGLGLANVQRRLAIAYPAQHQLSIEEDETFYTCQLLIYYNHERLAAEEAAHEHSQFISFQR